MKATEWLENQLQNSYKLGYFGASTGAAAALLAAANLQQVRAVVSRGGRPDLVLHILPEVQAATLLIVGSLDLDVVRLNQNAYMRLTGKKRLDIINGASHLFEEKGAMKKVCVAAVGWFAAQLQIATISS